MPAKPVKQQNRCFYWLTRDVAVGLAGAAQARRAGFSVHKDFRAAGIRFHLHKEFSQGDDATENGNFQKGKVGLQVHNLTCDV